MNTAVRRHVGSREYFSGADHQAPDRVRGRFNRSREPARGHRPHLSLRIRRQNEPGGCRDPVRYARQQRLGHPLRIEAAVHRASHFGECVGAGKLTSKRRLALPEPRRKVGTDRPGIPARGSTGARLPTSPGQSALRPIGMADSL